MAKFRFDPDKVMYAFCNCGKTKQDVAQEVNCSTQYINGLMRRNYTENNRINFFYAQKIAKALNTTINNLLAEPINESSNTHRLETLPQTQTKEPSCYGKLISEWLEYKGLYAEHLAKASELRIDTIVKIINGETKIPRKATLFRISKALNVSLEDFLKGVPATKKEDTLNEPIVADKPNEALVKQQPEESKQEPVKDEYLRSIPVWLYVLLEEEILDAHKGFKESTKAADKKCYASIVEMHSRLFVKGNTEQ